MPVIKFWGILFYRNTVGWIIYGNLEMAHRIVETDRQEVDFYKKYKDYYGYGFYVAQKFY